MERDLLKQSNEDILHVGETGAQKSRKCVGF
jgi:hypothetical protein